MRNRLRYDCRFLLLIAMFLCAFPLMASDSAEVDTIVGDLKYRFEYNSTVGDTVALCCGVGGKEVKDLVIPAEIQDNN